MISKRFHNNKQAGGGKKILIALKGTSTSSDITCEICARSALTNGNASAGVCSFLRYQQQSTMRHKYKWNHLCQPWNCLLPKRKKMHFRGMISLPESSQTDTGCLDYWAAFRHKPQSILW